MLKNDAHNEKAFIEIVEKSNVTPVSRDYKVIIDKINSQIFN